MGFIFSVLLYFGLYVKTLVSNIFDELNFIFTKNNLDTFVCCSKNISKEKIYHISV